jgi:hypothetical protein
LRGSLFQRSRSCAIPVGQLCYGPLGEGLGYEPVLVASGLLYALVVLLTLTSPSVRKLSRCLTHAPAK